MCLCMIYSLQSILIIADFFFLVGMGFIMNAGLFYFLFLVLSWAIYGLYERVELEGDERSFLFFFCETFIILLFICQHITIVLDTSCKERRSSTSPQATRKWAAKLASRLTKIKLQCSNCEAIS